MKRTARVLPPAPRHARAAKIFGVRQQLADGTYDIDGRLDSVLEKVLADVASRAGQAKGVPPERQAVDKLSVTAQAGEGDLPAPTLNASPTPSRRAG